MIDGYEKLPLVRDALLSLMTERRIPSQSAFARAVSLSNGYVCDVLACRRNLSPKVVDHIVEVYALTRKQAADLNHRAAQVAGWKLPPLPADQQVPLYPPAPVRLPPPPKALPKAKRKIIVNAKKPKQKPPPKKKPKKLPPARVLAHKTVKPVMLSMDNAPSRRRGFVPPTLEELTHDIEREMSDA